MNWKDAQLNKRAPLAVAIAVTVLSLVYSFAYRIVPLVDAQAYDSIAMNIVQGNGFREDAAKSYVADTAIIRAGPGYQYFLAGMYWFFGHSYEVVWVSQAILHGMSTLLVFFVCKNIFSERGAIIGIVSAAIFGFHPDLIEISAMLMTETLYLFFTVVSIYLFVRAVQRPNITANALLLGVGMGLGVLTRPPIIFFIPAVLWVYVQKRAWRSLMSFVMVLLVVFTPWVLHNITHYHQLILTTLIGDYNLWIGNTLTSNGGQIASGYNPVTAYGDVHGYVAISHEARRQFVAFIFQHPWEFVRLCFVRLLRFFSLIRPMGFWFYQGGVKQLLFVMSSAIAGVVLFVSGFTGMVVAVRNRVTWARHIVCMGLTIVPLLAITVVQSRYRFQLYPFLAIFGGYAIVQLWRERWWTNTSFVWVCLGLFMISVIDGLLHVSDIVGHLRLF